MWLRVKLVGATSLGRRGQGREVCRGWSSESASPRRTRLGGEKGGSRERGERNPREPRWARGGRAGPRGQGWVLGRDVWGWLLRSLGGLPPVRIPELLGGDTDPHISATPTMPPLGSQPWPLPCSERAWQCEGQPWRELLVPLGAALSVSRSPTPTSSFQFPAPLLPAPAIQFFPLIDFL